MVENSNEVQEKSLGLRLQTARKKAGLTQQQLCHKSGLSYSTLAKIERGAIKSPSVFTIQHIATVLGVSVDELLGNPDNIHHKQTSKSGISFVYFDINGCLVSFYQQAFGYVAKDVGVPSDIVETTFWHYNDAVCKGEMPLAEFNQTLAKKFEVSDFDWTHYYLSAIKPINETIELLIWAQEHYQVGLLSNIMPGLIDTMLDDGILPKLEYDAIIDSSVVGLIKPESEIFDLATQKANCPPDQILFVDDSRANLMAAARAGWRVAWFDDYQPGNTVQRVKDILAF